LSSGIPEEPFEPKEIVHLIFHGSTKFDTRDELARFGSGFLSTHLVSRVVRVRGRLTDGRRSTSTSTAQETQSAN